MSEQNGASSESLKSRAALLSLLAAVFLTSLKLGIGLYTNSLAILSEALHSGLDLLAALMTWYAIRVSARPADRRHPYGHGKVENLSALAETVLLFVVCGYVGYEGVHRLAEGTSPVLPSLWGVGCMVISMAVDINRVRTLRKVAKETSSQALEADALHFSTDIWASAVVFAGVLAVYLAEFFAVPEPWLSWVHQADTVAAMAVALIIFKVSLTMCRSALDFLMDAAPEETTAHLEKAVLDVPGVNSLRRLRLRSAGPDCFVDLIVGVDPSLSVVQGHRIASQVRLSVRRVLPKCDVLVHVDPISARKDPEGTFALVDRMARKAELDVHAIRVVRELNAAGTEEKGATERSATAAASSAEAGTRLVTPSVTATAHVEFEGKTTFRRAFEQCRAFEQACTKKDNSLAVFTHIEPRDSETSARVLAPGRDKLADFVEERVRAAVADEPLLTNPHALTCRVEEGNGLVIVFHCMVSGLLSVRQVHDCTVRLEQRLRAELPQTGSFFIHMEPSEPGQNEGCVEQGGAQQTLF